MASYSGQQPSLSRKSLERDTAHIKAGIEGWLAANVHRSNNAPVSVALLELTIERMIVDHGEAEALDFVRTAIQSLICK